VAHPSNIDTRSCKWYVLYCTCSLFLLTSHLLDLPQTAMVLTPIRAEGLGVGPLAFSAYREPTLVNYPQSNAPSPFKSSSTHNMSAKALAVEIWVLARPLPNGHETQALLTWTASAATGAMHIPIYVEHRQLHVQPMLLSQQHLHKRLTSDNGVECPRPSTLDVMLIHE